MRTEWCAAFVNAILELEGIPNNNHHKFPLLARSFLEWGQEQPEWSHMNKSFKSRELCQEYYQTNMGVRDDVMILYPNQRSHTLVCLDTKSLAELKGTQI